MLIWAPAVAVAKRQNLIIIIILVIFFEVNLFLQPSLIVSCRSIIFVNFEPRGGVFYIAVVGSPFVLFGLCVIVVYRWC